MPKKFKKEDDSKVAGWFFLIAVVIALVFGAISANWTVPLLLVIGIVLGLLCLAIRETTEFLLTSFFLVIIGAITPLIFSEIGIVALMIKSIAVIFTPITIIIALKHVFRSR
ncbi:MAG: hypothetical protein QXP53_02395 [Candidatus Pacearchaeota archaeon]